MKSAHWHLADSGKCSDNNKAEDGYWGGARPWQSYREVREALLDEEVGTRAKMEGGEDCSRQREQLNPKALMSQEPAWSVLGSAGGHCG